MRKIISMNQGWVFHKGDVEIPYPSSADKGPVYSQAKTTRKLIGPGAYKYFDRPNPYHRDGRFVEMRSENWRPVNLPHDYIISQTPNEEKGNCATGYFEYDNAWYRKHFDIEEEWRGKRILLRFGAIAGESTIYLNGCLMKHNFSYFNSFEIDITDYVFFDKENVLAVYVNGKGFQGWWYQGAGIYRNVDMVVTEPVALDLYGVYAPAKKLDEATWSVDFETTVINDLDYDTEFKVESDIIDADGTVVATGYGEGVAAYKDKAVINYSTKVNNPKLWDTETPNLYNITTRVYVKGELVDEDYTRIGFRTIEANPETGFYLNGKHTIIQGVCCHQDFGLTGIALPENVARYKVELIKQMGANGFRTSHYQNCDATMDALDELGMIVFNETRWFESTEENLEQLRMHVKRDRNRPSVVFWSTGNEEYYHITEQGPKIHKRMAAAIRKLDNTRFITSAQSEDPTISTIFDDCDVIAINYKHAAYDEVRKKYPNKAFISSENCATGTTRDWNYDSNGYRIKDKDRDTNAWYISREKNWKHFMARPYIMGGYQWDSIEHRGESVWPQLCSKSGAIDLFLQKKGAFYQNKSHWTTEPMVHIVPHWNFKGLEGEEIVVTVYTNCDELELFVNGVSQGVQQIEKYGHGEWNVIYAPGELKVIGRKDGKDVAEQTKKTTKKAERLVLRQDLGMRANLKDVAIFTCECVDEDGNIVPDAIPFVHFSVNEEAEIVGTGSDNCDHKKVTLPERKMYAGKITIGVRARTEDLDEIRLVAFNEDLGSALIKVPVIK